jgi:hypothetical protein
MNYKSGLIVAVAAIGISLAPGVGTSIAAAQGNCAGERVDGSTADQAARKMRAAGYTNLSGFHKGCDSYWHAVGTKDGQRVGVVLSPQGVVMTENAMDGSAGGAEITNTVTPMSPGGTMAPPPPMQAPPPSRSAPGPRG